MNRTVNPFFTSSRRFVKSSSTSWGTSTAVGSSKIRIFAPRKRTLAISTRCLSPTPRLASDSSGSISRPYKSAISINFLRASSYFTTKPNRVGSLPKITFSKTVALSANLKCWWTMPMPNLIASCGDRRVTSLPKNLMCPASGLTRP